MMNLSEMLSFADIHQLNRIASHYACECNTNSKRELIQSILNKINRNEVFDRYVEGLSVEEIRFLNSLIFDPRDTFSLEELLARAQLSRFQLEKPKPDSNASGLSDIAVSMKFDFSAQSNAKKKNAKPKPEKTAAGESTQWSPREMITRFAHQGWLFNGYSHQTRYLFQVPDDLKRRFGDSLTKSFQKRIRAMDEPPVYRDEQRLFVEDIHRFLTYIYHHPVELTADGAMYKRSQAAIMDTLAVKEELVGKGGWRFGYGRKIKEYPNRFSLIYDYCYYNGLIEETANELIVTEQAEERIVEGRLSDPSAVYQFWLRLYKNPIHNLQSLVHWLDRLAVRWVTLDTLSVVLCDLIKPYYYDSSDSILRRRIVMMMMHQGLLRIGEHPEGGTVVEMTPLGRRIVRGIYVQDEDKIDLPDDDGMRHGRMPV